MLQRGTLLPSDISHLATSSRPSGVGGKAEGVEGGGAAAGKLGNGVHKPYHVQLGETRSGTQKNYNYQHDDTDGWTRIKSWRVEFLQVAHKWFNYKRLYFSVGHPECCHISMYIHITTLAECCCDGFLLMSHLLLVKKTQQIFHSRWRTHMHNKPSEFKGTKHEWAVTGWKNDLRGVTGRMALSRSCQSLCVCRLPVVQVSALGWKSAVRKKKKKKERKKKKGGTN